MTFLNNGGVSRHITKNNLQSHIFLRKPVKLLGTNCIKVCGRHRNNIENPVNFQNRQFDSVFPLKKDTNGNCKADLSAVEAKEIKAKLWNKHNLSKSTKSGVHALYLKSSQWGVKPQMEQNDGAKQNLTQCVTARWNQAVGLFLRQPRCNYSSVLVWIGPLTVRWLLAVCVEEWTGFHRLSRSCFNLKEDQYKQKC